MIIINPGSAAYGVQEFHFKCEKCDCEWYAGRSDAALKISPPCCEFFAYMKCPNCGKECYDRS